ncbi:MAG: hypothetical protein PUD32_06780 [Bacteroidales bacterium]|nr:hypothetical protein [Bacteroidales bacterium]
MVNKNDNMCHFDKVRIELSLKACQYLGGITNGVTIWNIYSELLNQLSQTNGTIVKRGIQITLSEGELDCSVNSLCKRLGIGPKPMTKVLDRFVELGLIRRTPSKLASIADMVSVVGWTDEDGYHELCHSGEQTTDTLQSPTDAVEDNPSLFGHNPDSTPIEQPDKQILPDKCSTQDADEQHIKDDDAEQFQSGNLQQSDEQTPDDSPDEADNPSESIDAQEPDTSSNIDTHETSDEDPSVSEELQEQGDSSPTEASPLSMTDIVNQMTGANQGFVIPSVITSPPVRQKPHGKR